MWKYNAVFCATLQKCWVQVGWSLVSLGYGGQNGVEQQTTKGFVSLEINTSLAEFLSIFPGWMEDADDILFVA